MHSMMPKSVLLFAVFASVVSCRAKPAQPVLEIGKIPAQLEAYYKDRAKPPPYEAAITKLSAKDPEEREAASAYLRALLAQSLEDETNEVAPWRATVYWGSSGENLANKMREYLVENLANSGPSRGAVQVVRWYFEEEPSPVFQERAAIALGKITGPEATELRWEMASLPHRNCAIVVASLKQLADEPGNLPAIKLQALCHHYRPAIREAARALNRKQGGPDPGPFDPVKAMQSSEVQSVLGELESLHIDMPPANAPIIVATTTLFNHEKKQERVYTQRGWLVREEGDKLELFTPFGWKESLRGSDEMTKDEGDRFWWTRTFERLDIEAEVERIEKIREEGDPKFEFSERGGLSGQFQGHSAGLYEVLWTVRLNAAGRADLAARVLLPALNTRYLDEHLVGVAREELARIYGYQMLTAFVGDRDYARAETIAAILAEHFPKTAFYSDAVRLRNELPQRGEDFDSLALPTPARWKEMRGAMSRAQQIDYLCGRMRLLNCFQSSQPGSFSPDDPQFAEPCGLSRSAAWGLNRGRTEVINPFVELAGPFEWRDSERPRPTGLDLTPKDILQLSGYLRQDWSVLAVSFWRDFDASRTLKTTRPIFARVINLIANEDICKIDGWEKLSPAQIDEEIEQINRWAMENESKTSIKEGTQRAR